MKHFQAGKLFADPNQLDGLAGHFHHGQRRPAPGIPVQLGDHNAGHIQLGIKRFRHRHGFLTGHGIHHQQFFLRLQHAFHQ